MTTNKLEKIIYDFVNERYGKEEADNPSWNIPALAKHISTELEINMDNKQSIEPKKFAAGSTVFHKKYGRGRVIHVDQRRRRNDHYVSFDEGFMGPEYVSGHLLSDTPF